MVRDAVHMLFSSNFSDSIGAQNLNATQAITVDTSLQNQVEELSRIFNTAIVATRAPASSSLTDEVYQLMESPAFRAILMAVKQHATDQGVTEQAAAEEVIRTFRKIDTLWSEYVFQEGVSRLGSGS